METPESIRTSLIPGEWVSSIDLSDAYLHIPTHPNSRKYLRFCYKSQVFQFTSLPFGLATAPQGLYNDCKGSETNSPLKRTQNSPIPGRLADQVPVSGGSPSEHSGSGRPNPVLGVDNKSGKIRTETYSGVLVHGLRVPSRFSPCKTHSREMAQTPGFDPTPQVKMCFDCKIRCLMSLIRLLASTEKMVLEGCLHMRPFQFNLKEHWRYPPSFDRSHGSPPGLVAKSLKRDERRRPSSQRPQYPTLYRRLKRRLGLSLRPKRVCGQIKKKKKKKKATHKCPRIEGGLRGPSTFQGPVPEPNSVSCDGQLNSGSLHQQTRRNSLSRNVCSTVEDHDLVPSLPHNIESQAHSRVPECDGRPAVQVQPSAINRMVSASTGVQTDLPEVVRTSCRLICHSSEPQTSTVRISCPKPKGLGHRCPEHNWTNLTAYAYPPTALPHKVIQKIKQCHCLIIVIAPGWPGMPWFWDLVQLSTEIPLQLPVSTTLLKQSHNYVFHNNPQ